MNPLRWFSIYEPAKLSCSVNVVKILLRRARYSVAPSTIKGGDSHLRLGSGQTERNNSVRITASRRCQSEYVTSDGLPDCFVVNVFR